MQCRLCGILDKILNLNLLRRTQSDNARKWDIIQDNGLRYFKIDNAMVKKRQRGCSTLKKTKKRQNKIQWILAWKNRAIKDTLKQSEKFEYELYNR